MAGLQRGTVLVTGASTGIGETAAQRLARIGFKVLAGVRRQEDAERVAASSEAIESIQLDVTSAQDIESLAGRLDGQPLAGVVNNAGIAVLSPIEFVPLDDLRRQIEVNLIAQVAVTQVALPSLRQARGRIVNVSSVGGRVALPFAGPYAASKFGLEAISDSMRVELRKSGIQVSVVEPGSVATPIWQRGAQVADDILEQLPARARQLYGQNMARMREIALREGERGMDPERVADVIEHALTARRPKTRYPVGRGVRTRIILSRTLPDRLFDALVTRTIGLR